jgi:hypothetical protein
VGVFLCVDNLGHYFFFFLAAIIFFGAGCFFAAALDLLDFIDAQITTSLEARHLKVGLTFAYNPPWFTRASPNGRIRDAPRISDHHF